MDEEREVTYSGEKPIEPEYRKEKLDDRFLYNAF